MLRALLVVVFSMLAAASHAAGLSVATFNTESDTDTAPTKVAETIKAIGSFDILAVQEVESSAALKIYTDAAASTLGGRWRFVVSESGVNADRAADLLGIIYNIDRFRQLGTTELHVIRSKPNGTKYGKPEWSLRGALVLRLEDVASGTEFQVATIHLKCCDEPATRAHQAALLAKEVMANGLPTILLGDSNIPIEPGEDAPNTANLPAFDSLTADLGLGWVKPANPIKTQCDPAYNSMLDQIYAPTTLLPGATAEIKFPELAYCDMDSQGFSDHRPVIATIPNFLGTAAIEAFSAPMSAADEEARESILQQSGRPDDSIGR